MELGNPTTLDYEPVKKGKRLVTFKTTAVGTKMNTGSYRCFLGIGTGLSTLATYIAYSMFSNYLMSQIIAVLFNKTAVVQNTYDYLFGECDDFWQEVHF